ncbi:phage tail length tape measure family protein [Undibacterium sp. TJN19]|uniref:phage tail length tape measure family protein n=1 Tax=Undibacterium sp. TJN19 TaxID=3413055 RepID=UPI003BEFBAE8
MSEIANLVIAIDASSAKAAFVDVDKLTDASEKLDTATEELGKTSTKTSEIIGRQNEQMTQKKKVTDDVTDAGQRYIKALQLEHDLLDKTRAQVERANAIAQQFSKSEQDKAAAIGAAIEKLQAQERVASEFAKAQDAAARKADEFVASLKRQADTLNMTRQEMLSYKAAQLGVSTEASPFIEKLGGAEGGMHKLNFATAGARRELIVLAHEASQGQWSRFGGSLMVLGERTDALGLLFSGTGMAIGAAAVVLGGFAYLAIKGASEVNEFNKTLIVTNNYAGLTRDSLHTMAEGLATSQTSAHSASVMLAELAATGKYTGGEIEAVGKMAIKMSELTGQSADEVVKEFDGITKNVTTWAANANEKYHFMGALEYERIHQLQEHGRAQEALMVVMGLMDKAMDTSAQKVGYLTQWWQGLKFVFTEVISSAMNVGAGLSKADVVADEIAKLNALKKRLAEVPSIDIFGTKDTLVAAITEQRKAVTAAVKSANDEEIAAGNKQRDALIKGQAVTAQIELDNLIKANRTKEQIRADDARKIQMWAEKVNADYLNQGLAEKYNQAAIDKLIEDDAEKHKDKMTKIAGQDSRGAELAGKIKAQQDEIDSEKRKNDELQKLDDLLRKYHQISDDEFYDNQQTRALALEQIQVESYKKQLKTYEDFVVKTNVESAKRANDIAATLKKITEAEAAYADHSRRITIEKGLAQDKVISDSDDLMNKYISTLTKEADQLEANNVAKEQSKAAVERLDIATNNLAISTQQEVIATEAAKGTNYAILDSYQKIIDKLQEINFQKNRKATALDIADEDKRIKEQAKKAETAWEATNKSIGDGLYNAIGRGGGNAFKKLLEDVKSWFARLVLSPIISPIASFGASLINPSAASAQGSYGSALGLASNGISGASNGTSLIGNGISAVGSYFGFGSAATPGATAVGTGALNALGIETTSTAIGGSAATGGGLMSGAASALGSIPVIGWIALAAAAAAYFGSGKDRVQTGVGISGNLGTQDLTRDVSWTKNGGWFNPDTSGTWKYNLGTSSTTVDGRQYTDSANQTSDQALLKNVTGAYDALKTASADYAKTLGIDAAYLKDRTQAISGSLGTTAEEIQKNLSEIFKNVGNDISAELLNIGTNAGGGLKGLQKDGEDASTTLARLANDFKSVDSVLLSLGKDSQAAFGAVGLASVAMREKLIDLAGGAQAFSANAAYFAQNFLTAAEQIKPTMDSVTAKMSSLGLSSVTTIEQFKNVVKGLDLSTEAGRQEYTALMQIAPAFKQVADYTTELNASLDNTAAATQAATDLLKQRRSMEIQIMELTGDAAGALAAKQADELAAMNSTLQPLQERINLLTAEQEAAAAAAELSKSRTQLQIGLLDALGDAEGSLALQRKLTLDATTDLVSKDILTKTFAAQDAAAAAQKAQAAQAAAQQEAQRIQQEAQAAAQAAQQAYDQRLSAAKSALQTAYNAEATAIQNVISKMQSFATAARAMQLTLVNSAISPQSIADQYANAKADLPGVIADANSGDQTAIAKLQKFVELSQQSNSNFVDYVKDFDTVQNVLDDSATAAERMVKQNQSQLDLLKSQVDGLLNVNNSVLSVSDAVKALQDLMAQGLGGVASAVNGQYLANNPASASSAVTTTTVMTPDQIYGGLPGEGTLQAARSQAMKSDAQKAKQVQDYIDAAYKKDLDSVTGYAPGNDYYNSLNTKYFGAAAFEKFARQLGLYANPLTGAGYGLPVDDGSHADGLDFVPFDGYRAKLHHGERVKTAAQARQEDKGQTELINEIRLMRAEVRAVASNTSGTYKTLDRWTNVGMPATESP